MRDSKGSLLLERSWYEFRDISTVIYVICYWILYNSSYILKYAIKICLHPQILTYPLSNTLIRTSYFAKYINIYLIEY